MLTARPLGPTTAYDLLADAGLLGGVTKREWQAAFEAGNYVALSAEEGSGPVGVAVAEVRRGGFHLHLLDGSTETRRFLMGELLALARSGKIRYTDQAGKPSPASC